MNQILYGRDMLLNRDNEGIIAELLKQEGSYNTIWGEEYYIMNEKSFLDNNIDAIIDMMIKCKGIVGN